MKAILQRCLKASVRADGEPAGNIEHGLFILLGVIVFVNALHVLKNTT